MSEASTRRKAKLLPCGLAARPWVACLAGTKGGSRLLAALGARASQAEAWAEQPDLDPIWRCTGMAVRLISVYRAEVALFGVDKAKVKRGRFAAPLWPIWRSAPCHALYVDVIKVLGFELCF